MKKLVRYGVMCLMALVLLSCGSNKKAETLADLKAKYEGKSFKDCDTFLTAYEEIFDVYFKVLDKAVQGDENALKEFSDFDYFLADFGQNATGLIETCPEKFEEFGEKIEKTMMENLPKLMSLYGGQMNDLGVDADEDPEGVIIEEDAIEVE